MKKKDKQQGYAIIDAKVYYLGALTYVLKTKHPQKGTIYTDISTGDAQTSAENNIAGEDKILGSGKDSEGKVISTPKDYVSGKILSSKVYDVPGSTKISSQGTKTYRQYFEMNEFSAGTVCTPVAITNLYYHWSRYDSNHFSALKYDSWKNTYAKMAVLCNTSTSTGTNLGYVDSAIEWYCTSRKIKCKSKTYSGTNGGAKIVAELKNRRPCVLHVYNHKKYEDHSMLALGYETYRYKSGSSEKTDIYIRVADGWTKSSGRYVWGGCRGNWDYTSVMFST